MLSSATKMQTRGSLPIPLQYQGLGTLSALGSADHELTAKLFYGSHPHELFHGGRSAWFFKTPFPEDFKSPAGDWLEHKQSLANQAGTNLRHFRVRELS